MEGDIEWRKEMEGDRRRKYELGDEWRDGGWR